VFCSTRSKAIKVKTVLLQESGGRGRVLGNVHDAPVEILRLLNSSLNFVPEPVMARW
jgi:hypothetical protein